MRFTVGGHGCFQDAIQELLTQEKIPMKHVVNAVEDHAHSVSVPFDRIRVQAQQLVYWTMKTPDPSLPYELLEASQQDRRLRRALALKL